MTIKEQIDRLVKDHLESVETKRKGVPISGKVYDQEELTNLINCVLEGWWTEGKWCKQFEEAIQEFLGISHALTVNSGSSANFIAMKTLSSVHLGEKRIMPGDEVITVAAGFPTTVNPILDIGAIPVFVDVDIPTYNANIDQIKEAITPRTKAIILAHTLGNPFDAEAIRKICKEHDLWLVEDCCDAFGSTYQDEFVGTLGDIGTISFYPAHHITTAEGGAVLINDDKLFKIAQSLRDWGRDCTCPTGKDNCCGKRFGWKKGDLPFGFDHKYIYSEIGYNLKMTDFQGALGVAQIKKLEAFGTRRRENFVYLKEKLEPLKEYFILPEATKGSDPSWFGFPITIKDKSVQRQELLNFLDKKSIGTRLLFGGNLTKQPYFIDNKFEYRIVGDLKNTDTIMNDTFWVGVYPGISFKDLDTIVDAFKEFLEK